MKPRACVAVGLVGSLLVVVSAACDDEQCNCPLIGPATIRVLAPCDVNPSLSASGACTFAGPSAGELLVTGSEMGTCHLLLIHDDGTLSSADFPITSEWLACGSDPHGCGERFDAPTLGGGFPQTITLGSATCDAGTTDGG